MNRKLRGFFYTIPGVLIGVVGASSCDKVTDAVGGIADDICGPCGEIAKGDVSISGNAQFDGFFMAVGSLQSATASINGDFQANIMALASVYGVTATSFSAKVVDDVIAAIKADFAANASAGVSVNYKPPECSANVNVAVQAQAQCEAHANCDVKANPGSVSVQCDGNCSGGCSGGCTGSASCVVTAPTVNCSGSCEGTCEMSAAATCDGTCHGDCSGTCSLKDASGKCQGTCSGNCTGSCELKAQAKCTGTCHGKCMVDQGAAECKGDVQCNGKCDAQCSGGCQGSATPPSASASCDASAKCNAQASAQANAKLQCSPPSLDLAYNFSAGITAGAQASFVARLGELKARAAAIVQGSAQLSALINGKINGKVVFPKPPLVQLTDSIQGFATGDVSAFGDIPKGRIACVIPAFAAAGKALADVSASVGDTITAQGKFVAYITNPT